MATRLLYEGDSTPPMRFALTSGGQTAALQSATSIAVTFIGALRTFSGPGIALSPFQTDPATPRVSYNLAYEFGATDTSEPDSFATFVVVEWPQGQQTFQANNTLRVLASIPPEASPNTQMVIET